MRPTLSKWFSTLELHTLATALLHDQNRIIPFGLIVQYHKTKEH